MIIPKSIDTHSSIKTNEKTHHFYNLWLMLITENQLFNKLMLYKPINTFKS
jgi:hypothetical protein